MFNGISGRISIGWIGVCGIGYVTHGSTVGLGCVLIQYASIEKKISTGMDTCYAQCGLICRQSSLERMSLAAHNRR